jgi:glycosyltransferase involved in cell wall biosynthesis
MKTIVFHVNVLLAGGIEKVLIELLDALDPNRYHIILSITHYLGDAEILKDKIPPYVRVRYLLESPVLTFAKKKKVQHRISFPEKLFEELVLPVFKKFAIKRKLRAIAAEADVIIDFDMTLAPYYKLMAEKRKIAYCHFSLAQYLRSNKRKLDKLVRRLSHYDRVVMLCDEMVENAAALYPSLAPKLLRIYNALDLQRIRLLATEEAGDLPGLGKHYFVAVGRLQESQKDFATVIKAYAACVRKYGIGQQLLIVGDGPDRTSLENLAKSERLGEKVIFSGFQGNPYKWIGNAELFLFGSRYEGLPTVLIEALALNKPIVATACPTGVKEILMHGKAGLLTEPENVPQFCEAIFSLLHDAERQEEYKSSAPVILAQFDIKNVIRSIEDRLLS